MPGITAWENKSCLLWRSETITLQSKTHAITLVCHFPCVVPEVMLRFLLKLIELGADHSADFRRPFALLYAYAFVQDLPVS